MKEAESNQDKFPGLDREEAVARMKQRYEEDERARQEGRPLPQAQGSWTEDMSDFRHALIATAIASFTGVGLVVAIGLLVYYAVKGKGQTVAGIAAGIGIAIMVVGVTCFAILANL